MLYTHFMFLFFGEEKDREEEVSTEQILDWFRNTVTKQYDKASASKKERQRRGESERDGEILWKTLHLIEKADVSHTNKEQLTV